MLNFPIVQNMNLDKNSSRGKSPCIPVNILCLVFVILSFFKAPYRSILALIGSSTNIVIIVVVLGLGFIVRSIISRRFQ